jgi:hypothetical protein
MARVCHVNSFVDKGIDVIGEHASPFGGGSGDAQTDCAHGSFPHIAPADKPPSLEHVPVQFGGPSKGENGTPLSAQLPARISILSGGCEQSPFDVSHVHAPQTAGGATSSS